MHLDGLTFASGTRFHFDLNLFDTETPAIAYLVLENLLSGFTEHWQAILGPFLVLVVLFSKSGLLGAVGEWRAKFFHA